MKRAQSFGNAFRVIQTINGEQDLLAVETPAQLGEMFRRGRVPVQRSCKLFWRDAD